MEKDYKLIYEDFISYAHILITPPCNVLHGHNAKVRIIIQQAEGLPADGMVINFHHLKSILKAFDHITLVNEEHRVDWVGKNKEHVLIRITGKEYTLPVGDVMFLANEPTVEHLADVIYDQILGLFGGRNIKMCVRLWETEKGSSAYGDVSLE